MRIALVYDGVYPYSVGGGEKIFHDLARYLGARHEVHLLGLKLWDGPAMLNVAPGVCLHGICDPVTRNVLQSGDERSLKQALLFSWKTFFALKRLGPFDVIDCMATPYFPLYAAFFRARLSKTPIVSTWLELWSLEHWREYIGGESKARLAYGIEQFATKLPRHIVSISPHTSIGLQGSGVTASRLSTITPWIDNKAIQAVPPDSVTSDIIFVGRLIKSKGVTLLIDALAQVVERIPDVRCRIVGDGPERGHLETMIREHGLEENAILEGFLESHDHVISAMKSSCVFVLPSRREGFGIVVIEAVSSGLLPVTIESPNNASRDLVRESACGAVCDEEPGALAETLCDLLSQPEDIRAKQIERGQAWAMGYDLQQGAALYEATYQRVAGEVE